MLDRDAPLFAVSAAASDSHRLAKMAPSPENDTTPKAPDKGADRARHDRCHAEGPREAPKDDKTPTVDDLNDGELRALLDEAANYKNPKDREGKSKLFNCLLDEAEEDERNARASRAGGSELVRYHNPAAKRGSRHRKKRSSVSENLMHGGSLDNLAKDELYEAAKVRSRKSVSARQREGGSLPCNVNAGAIVSLECQYQFLEEARCKKEKPATKSAYASSTCGGAVGGAAALADLETERLLEKVSLENKEQQKEGIVTKESLTVPLQTVHFPEVQHAKFTSRASLQVNNVDEPNQLAHQDSANVEHRNKTLAESKVLQPSRYNFLKFPNYNLSASRIDDSKKVDENGNALQQNPVSNRAKKKKILADKNVVVCTSENVEGHRSDIINDVHKLMEYIGVPATDGKRSNPSKSKQLNRQHNSEDKGTAGGGKKQRAHSSKAKEGRAKLKKSNSMGEISTTNLEDFEFVQDEDHQVVMRNKSNPGSGSVGGEKQRERRSWGNVEPLPNIQNLYSNAASMENLETAEFRVVTKKKKSKKRRSSVDGRSKTSAGSGGKGMINTRASSPDLRRKTACSVPHSEKSNDSSDVDSVHSLPIDGTSHHQRLEDLASSPINHIPNENMPISYADMARNSDPTKPKDKQTAKPCNAMSSPPSYVTSNADDVINSAMNKVPKESSPPSASFASESTSSAKSSSSSPTITSPSNDHGTNLCLSSSSSNSSSGFSSGSNASRNSPPDVHNIKSFPAIKSSVVVQQQQHLHHHLHQQHPQLHQQQCNSTVQTPPQAPKVSSTSTPVAVPAAPVVNKTGKSVSNASTNTPIMVNNVMVTRAPVKGQGMVQPMVYSNPEQASYLMQSFPVFEYSTQLPPDIPDVQTIEKLQMLHQGHRVPTHCYDGSATGGAPMGGGRGGVPFVVATDQNNHHQNRHQYPQTTGAVASRNDCSVDCDNNNRSERTSATAAPANGSAAVAPGPETEDARRPPPVVILSGLDSNKEVPGLVFGFDVNEQLLSEDRDFICEEFASRFVTPETYTATSHNHDKIVHYIGSAWEETVGKVEYYSEEIL